MKQVVSYFNTSIWTLVSFILVISLILIPLASFLSYSFFTVEGTDIIHEFSFFNYIEFFTGEIYIKWDDSSEEEWLILIYIKNNSPDEGIIIEDKTNPEKNMTYEFQSNEIFKASDVMVDALTKLLDVERNKRKVN